MESQPTANPAMNPAVQQALARRGIGSAAQGQGALTQVSPGAAMANPVPQPMNPSEMTQASAPQGGPTPTAPQMPKFQPQDRTDLITLALIEKMKNDGKMAKEQTKMGATPAPAPSEAPAAPSTDMSTPLPMGGGSATTFTSNWSQPSQSVSQQQSNYNYGMGKDYSGMNNYGQGKGY
jgi:hypothetical protein